MKISDLSTTNDKGNAEPSQLVARFIAAEEEHQTIGDFVQQFDFDSEDEMRNAIVDIITAIACDDYLCDKNLASKNRRRYALWVRTKKIFWDANKLRQYPSGVAGEAWVRYSRTRMNQRCKEMWGDVKADEAVFAETCERIKAIYSLNDTDIDKMRFFVEQVKAGEAFPNSLRRMLYIWGDAKKTGKTTSATMLVSILNGDENENHISRYSSKLSDEMQIGGFKVPRIAQCNCVMMDECFFADMGKVYADFKRFLTSSDGRARLPYGQEFQWFGRPNYIATSNDPVNQFIKDWDDRRYCSVEFKTRPTEQLDFPEIKALWKSFVVNSTPADSWQRWSERLMETATETGSRSVIKSEYEIELEKTKFYNFINEMKGGSYKLSNENRITLRTIITYFGDEGQTQSAKHRDEIRKAMVAVFGETYQGRNFWLLPDIKEKLESIRRESDGDGKSNEALPF